MLNKDAGFQRIPGDCADAPRKGFLHDVYGNWDAHGSRKKQKALCRIHVQSMRLVRNIDVETRRFIRAHRTPYYLVPHFFLTHLCKEDVHNKRCQALPDSWGLGSDRRPSKGIFRVYMDHMGASNNQGALIQTSNSRALLQEHLRKGPWVYMNSHVVLSATCQRSWVRVRPRPGLK